MISAERRFVTVPCKMVFNDRKTTAETDRVQPTTEKFTSLKEQIAPPPQTGIMAQYAQLL